MTTGTPTASRWSTTAACCSNSARRTPTECSAADSDPLRTRSQPWVLVAALLLIAGVIASTTSSRLGVPSLLLFIGLGMLAGSDGTLGIEFDDFELAQSFGAIALGFILFSGVLGTRFTDVRPVLWRGITADRGRRVSFDTVLTGDDELQLHELTVEPGAPVVGHQIVDLDLPTGLLIVLVRRDDETFMRQGSTVLEENDEVLLAAEPQHDPAIERLFRPHPTPPTTGQVKP